jgi:peptidoglycan/LPS O-acetylase OafA/YrhL
MKMRISLLLIYFLFLYGIFTTTLKHDIHNMEKFEVNNSTIKTFKNFSQNNSLKISEEDHPCEIKTQMILRKILNQSEIPQEYSDFQNMILFSGTGMNDWGDYVGCKKLLKYSNFFMINYKIALPGTNISTVAQIGLCYFKECDLEYMTNAKEHIVLLLNSTLNLNIDSSTLFIEDPEVNQNTIMNSKLVGFSIVMSFLCLFVVLSILHYCTKNRNRKRKTLLFDVEEEKRTRKSFLENENNLSNDQDTTGFYRVLVLFDVQKNVKKLFEINDRDETQKALRVFDGVRYLSTAWVVFGHTFFVSLLIGYKNSIDVPYLVTEWKYAILLAGPYSVDVFFFLSGFFLNYGLQKYFNKKAAINKFKVFTFIFINRYLRLLPLYLFAIFGMTYILPFIGNGPNYEKSESVNAACPTYFWRNLLFIQNFFPAAQMCSGVTWYLANDMQFFLLSLIIFLILSARKTLRMIVFGFIYISTSVFSIYISLYHKYRFMDIAHGAGDDNSSFDTFYDKPWTRISPYIIGLFFCDLFLESPVYIKNQKNLSEKYEQESLIKKINNFFIRSNFASTLIFIISLMLINFAVFINTIVNRYDLPLIYNALFSTFNKQIFVFGLGCILHLTFLNKFTFIRSILSIPLFSCISRVTYGIYLIHYYILVYFFFSADSQFYLKFGNFVYLSIGFFNMSMTISLVVTILIESPIINGIKLLLEGDKHEKDHNYCKEKNKSIDE